MMLETASDLEVSVPNLDSAIPTNGAEISGVSLDDR